MTHKSNGKHNWQIGQRVRILDGPFSDFTGTIDAIDTKRKRIRVMISFFYRDTPVDLSYDQITPIIS